MFTKLRNRKLWYDGDTTVPADSILAIVTKSGSTKGLCVDQMTKDITEYNKLVPKAEQVKVKDGLAELDFTWKLPERIANLDLETYLLEKLDSELSDRIDDHHHCSICVTRVLDELARYTELQKLDALKATIFIIETFEAKQIVWGIGRGSCVSSYILYLIGIHDVDSVLYDLDITEFLG
jgi:hypothetical protein